MRMRTIILAVILSGCASPTIWWTKPGFDMAQFRQDDYACTQDAFNTRWGSSGVLYRQCMMARGYNERTPP